MFKRVVLVLSFATISTLYPLDQSQLSESIKEQTTQWAQSATQSLNADDINLLANTLFFFYKLATVDAQMRILADKATNNYIVMRKTLDGFEQNQASDAQAELVRVCDHFIKNVVLLKELSLRRKPIFKTWNHCQQMVEEKCSENPLFDQSISEFQALCQAVIRTYLESQENRTQSILSETEKSIFGTISMLNVIAHTFQGMRVNDERLGFTYDAVNTMDVATRLADTLESYGYNTLETATLISLKSVGMQQVTSALLAHVYTLFYETLSLDQRNQLLVMFDESGVISAEQRVFLLPLPEKLIGR